MKTASLLLAALMLIQTTPFAQGSKSATPNNSYETIILDRSNVGSTTIEINENGVFLNGDRVVTRSELNNRNIRKRIIIQNNDRTTNATRDWEDYYNSGRSGNNTGGRALLGVFTDTRKSGDGAYIDRVSPNSAAEKAGLRTGDVILKVDSSYVYSAEDLTRIIRYYRPGDRVTIAYNRNGKDRQTTAVLDESGSEAWLRIYEDPYRNDIPAMPPMPRNFPFGNDRFYESRPRLGVNVEDSNNGVVIKSVRTGSVAETAGLRVGDIITFVDNKKIETVDELQRIVSNAKPGTGMKIELDRNGIRITRTVLFPREKNARDL